MALSNVWFTSDLHLGHMFAARARGFESTEEHDDAVIEGINSTIGKRDKLFILGDAAFSKAGLGKLAQITGIKELIIGNHDTYKTEDYLRDFVRVHGFRQYKGFWLSHCPIHPQEIYRCHGNIHGHIHKGAATKPLPLPYFNVNVDFWDLKPVNFDTILSNYDTSEKSLDEVLLDR